MNRFPDQLLRLVLNGPSVLASLVTYLIILASLPDAITLPALVVLVVAMLIPASSRAETVVVRVVTRSRPASSDELAVWARIEALVNPIGVRVGAVDERCVLVRRFPQSCAAPVTHAARTSVVVSPLVLHRLATHQLSPRVLACEVASKRVSHHYAAQRGAVGGWVMTLPIRVLVVGLNPLLRRMFGWAPFRVAWQLRVVFGAIGVADGVARGRAWVGIAAGVLVLFSYLVPAARGEVARRAASQADIVRSAAAHSQGLLGAAPRPGHLAETDGPQRVALPASTESRPFADASHRPRLYLVRTE